MVRHLRRRMGKEEHMTDILIVEDHKELSGLLRDFLSAEGYVVRIAETGEQALQLYEEYGARLLVLDILLPGMDGFAVCRKIPESSNTPILIVSARTDKEDKLNGLFSGADDYIEKPYDIDIMIAKIKGIFQRRYALDVIADGDLQLKKGDRAALLRGEELELTTKEFDLLLLLMENKGKVLHKEYIFNQVWGLDSCSEPQTLTVHIKWLRQKIEVDPKHPKRIITVWGVGYQFV